MAVTVVRPDSTNSGASNFTVTGAATLHAATNDNSDSTFVRKTGTGTKSAIVGFGTTALGASQTVSRVRVRARVQGPTSATKLNLQLGTRVDGVNYFSSALAVRGVVATGEVVGPWYAASPDGGSWDQARIDNLRCQITDYKDSGDRGFVYELYIDVDIANQATVTVSAPTGTVTTTSKPDVSWSVTDPDGDIATSYQVKVISSATYTAAGFDPSTSAASWDSGQVTGTDVSASVGDFLLNGTYRAYVRVAKDVNGVPFWSGWAFSQFTISLSPPTVPTLSLTYTAGENKTAITVTGAAPTGFTSQTFEVQRTSNAGTTWSQVRYATALIPNGSYVATVTDNEPPRGATVGYRVRAIGLSGANVQASAWSATSNVTTVNDGTWVFKTLEPTAQVATDVAVQPDDAWEEPEQIGIFRPIGRTYPVVVAGALEADSGSYRIVAASTAAYTALAPLIAYQGTLLVLSPFGDQKYVRIISRSVTRTGTKDRPRYEYDLGYVEVTG